MVQEAVIKTIPKKKKCKKAKRLSEEALQIAKKRREAKGKGKKERYTHLNAEFQRTARRDKKAFLSDQCKKKQKKKQNGKDQSLKVLMRWMKLEPIIQSEVSQKEKYQYHILTHIYGIQKDGNDNPVCETAKETRMYRTIFWTLWEREWGDDLGEWH